MFLDPRIIVIISLSPTVEVGFRNPNCPMFDRFFRGTHTRAQSPDGTGPGLSIVQSVCTAHGGDVTVENLKTGGCRFHVVLPLSKAK
jgi:signal transduction histidine kinase